MGGKGERCNDGNNRVPNGMTAEQDRSPGRPDYDLMYKKFKSAADSTMALPLSDQIEQAFIMARVKADAAMMSLRPPSGTALSMLSMERLESTHPNNRRPEVERQLVATALEALDTWVAKFQEIPQQPSPPEELQEINQWLRYRQQQLEKTSSSPGF